MAWLALAGAIVVMGGQFAVAKRGLAAGLTAYDIVALRFVGAAGVAAIVLHRRGLHRLGGVGWGRATVLAVIAGSPYAVLMYVAMEFAPAAHGAMLVPGIGLVLATVIGAAWVGERHTRARYVGVGIVLAGLATLGLGSATGPSATIIGDLLLVVVGVSWGTFTLLMKRWRLDALASTAALSVISLVYLPVYVLALEPRLTPVPMRELIVQAGYQGVLQTVFAFAGYAFAVNRLGAGTAAVASAAIPVVGTLLAIPLAGEWPSRSTWAGLVAVCVGIAAANARGPRRADSGDEAAGPSRTGAAKLGAWTRKT